MVEVEVEVEVVEPKLEVKELVVSDAGADAVEMPVVSSLLVEVGVVVSVVDTTVAAAVRSTAVVVAIGMPLTTSRAA